eukprot:CAMPEP_0197275174 /NCGR_PEP_ID=MMETSP1432-20130617/13588_1 /TAXON_ID=44447 /ORGANISM="Pseudo-nitzschia delicatissima, Strain UNC1205" /LENGTH=58 /DNA_ID=CAMNT_0042741053 /DNA_START=32 /DNA_END=205 /DNA_ORIENTATION=-
MSRAVDSARRSGDRDRWKEHSLSRRIVWFSQDRGDMVMGRQESVVSGFDEFVYEGSKI